MACIWQFFETQCQDFSQSYWSLRSVNCFSKLDISSRHSILLLSQSSSSISGTGECITQCTKFITMELAVKPLLFIAVTDMIRKGMLCSFSTISDFLTRTVSILRDRGRVRVLLLRAGCVLLLILYLHLLCCALLLLSVTMNRHDSWLTANWAWRTEKKWCACLSVLSTTDILQLLQTYMCTHQAPHFKSLCLCLHLSVCPSFCYCVKKYVLFIDFSIFQQSHEILSDIQMQGLTLCRRIVTH